MSALGTGITGGEPLLVLDKVTEYFRLLKKHFGPGHQIHLYTAKAPTDEDLAEMQGLVDEYRLHPPHECWLEILNSDFLTSAQHAKEMGFDIGIGIAAKRASTISASSRRRPSRSRRERPAFCLLRKS